MFCKNCGAEIPDDVKFCSKCGEPILSDSNSQDVVQSIGAASTAVDDVSSIEQKPDNGKKRKIIIISCIVAVVIVAAIVGFFFWKSYSDNQAAHAPRSVRFAITATDYDPATASKIPIHIKGTDMDGNPVDSVSYVTTEESVVELVQGTYTAQIDVSPILSDGRLYAVPSDIVNLTIADGSVGVDANGNNTDDAPQLTLTLLNADKTTTDMIDASYQAALDSGMSESDALALKQKATDRRTAALQQDSSSNTSSTTTPTSDNTGYSNEYFSVTVPQSWAGNWSVTESTDGGDMLYAFNSNPPGENNGGAITVRVTNNPDFKLATTSYEFPQLVGYTDGYTVAFESAAGGAFFKNGDSDYATLTLASDPTIAENARNSLEVPVGRGITYVVATNSVYWESGGAYTRNIAFYKDGTVIASADCDPKTGEPLKSIMKYSG